MNGERILIGNGEGHVNKLLINKSNTFELIQDKIYDAPGAIMYLVSPAQNYIPFNKSELILGTQEGELRLVNITSNNKILRKQWPLDSINFGSPISPTFCNCGENYEYGLLAGLGNGRFVFLKKDTSKLDNFIVSKAAHPFDTLDICLLYTSDAADERSSVDLGGRRIIKKKTSKNNVKEQHIELKKEK